MSATRRAMLAMLAAGALAALSPAAAAREVHGESDVFSIDGVAIAWGILRAANPDEATVVMRIARDASRFPALGVVAIDPFGGQSQVVRAPAAAPGTLDVASRRARFADFARTEVRLYAAAQPGPGDAPALVVFYQGVPDTAPEFESEAKLCAWLDERIARLRKPREGGGK